MQVTTDDRHPVQNSGVQALRGVESRRALAGALDRVGDRWSLLVVDALAGGPRRFADLQEEVPGIATNVLAQRLRRLEAEQIVLAVPYSRRPLRYAYELTAAGRALGGAATILAQWNADHGAADDRTPSHEVCGTPMEVHWYCPTCNLSAGVGGAEATGDEILWV
jgi:DNA-binding HxlR family transcriptional regulator